MKSLINGFRKWRSRGNKEKAFEVRFADDALLCFENKTDVLKVMEVLPERLTKFGLELHLEKIKSVNFTSPQENGCN